MVSHQLAGGLEDVSIQVRVLALAATEKKLDLTKIVEYVKAQETGTRSSKLIGQRTEKKPHQLEIKNQTMKTNIITAPSLGTATDQTLKSRKVCQNIE